MRQFRARERPWTVQACQEELPKNGRDKGKEVGLAKSASSASFKDSLENILQVNTQAVAIQGHGNSTHQVKS